MLGKLLMKIRDTINNQNYIVNLLDRINQNLNTNISGITLKVIENTELDGIKLTGDMKKYEKIIINIGNSIPMEFQWFRFSKSTNNYVKEGNPVHINIKDGDMLIFSNKAIGHDCERKSVLSVRHSIGDKFLDIV